MCKKVAACPILRLFWLVRAGYEGQQQQRLCCLLLHSWSNNNNITVVVDTQTHSNQDHVLSTMVPAQTHSGRRPPPEMKKGKEDKLDEIVSHEFLVFLSADEEDGLYPWGGEHGSDSHSLFFCPQQLAQFWPMFC